MNYSVETIRSSARQGLPLEITSFTLPPETETHLEEILTVFLEQMDQLELKDHLVYCLRELTVNSKKANTKRVFFREQGLDIKNPKDYEKGIVDFKQKTLDNIGHYLKLQEEEGLYVKVSFQIISKTLYIQIKNNTPITNKELSRIYDRIARSRAFDSMEEAFTEVLDETEGAGLGIVIMVLMLRKMGLSEKAFDVTATDHETTASLTIPINQIKLDKINLLTDEILKVIDSLPPFPENIRRIQISLTDPDVDLSKVALTVAQDPALTSDLIKYVNSALFSLRKKVDSIDEAVRMVGIKGLNQILYPYGAQKILSSYNLKQKELWDDAAKVSSYSMIMAAKFKFTREQQSEAQIAGILHNLGRIILSLTHPKLSQRIMEFCKGKTISVEVFEDLAAGMTHSEIGGRLAEKWKFPEDLIDLIQHHTQPQVAQKSNQPLACVLNLAASFVEVERGRLDLYQINKTVLKALKIPHLEATTQLYEELKAEFEKRH